MTVAANVGIVAILHRKSARYWIASLLALGAAAAAALWILTAPRPAFPSGAAFPDCGGDAERGRLVFAAADCASCHASPGQSDRLHLGGGLVIESPYGTLHVPNISQDPVDGIGNWRAVDLANALLNGVSPRRRHYYPVFPYASYTKMRVEDIVDLMAYLRTLPAVHGRPPPHDLTFPFNVRRGIGIWKLLYLDRDPIVPDATRSAEWNRGRYLVTAMAHCDECHSSRNLLGAIKPKSRFAGGRDPTGTGFTPNITPTGIGDWTVDDMVRMLTDGRTPDLRTVGSSMAEVVTNTHELPEQDRRAVAVYVKTLTARPTATP
jgi:mono/diheme cytochrome c family protein